MKKLYIILLINIMQAFSPKLYAQSDNTIELSDAAYASILTCGPGDEFYESFGHTALRICDTNNDLDVVFNYGCFDFAEPHFYLKFTKGRLNYFVLGVPFAEFMMEYQHYKRAVWEQRLRLEKDELSRLFDSLMVNIRPENMFYQYDLFRDNCATRVYDMINKALSPERKMKFSRPEHSTTQRDLIHKYTEDTLLWWRFGVDLMLGCKTDKAMQTEEYMYVPMEMMTIYDTTIMSDGKPLAEPPVQLLADHRDKKCRSLSPTLFFWILFVIIAVLTFFSYRKGWKLYWLDGIIFGLVSLISIVLLYMTLFSDHWCTKTNLNLIWANPLYIWPLVRLRKYDPVVYVAIGCILLALLVGWAWWPQEFNPAVLPIVLIIMTRIVSRLVK
ncbi:MAG: DUF4105 domain-containing protein [Bacteroidales bacterium]|nr:DUF4105 domain-containing protein [Bacteroidales bacterium]